MLKKKYKSAKRATLIIAILLEIAVCVMAYLKFDILFIILPAAVFVIIALIFTHKLIAKIFRDKIEDCLYEDCDPDKYLFEFTTFYGYVKVEYNKNHFNIAKLKAYTAMGKMVEAFKIAEKIDMKKLNRNGIHKAEYNICMTALNIYSESYEKAEAYLNELSKLKRKFFKKQEITVKHYRAELLRHQGNLSRARALFTSLNLAKRNKMDLLSARLAIGYIDKAEKFDDSARKNFEIVAREANRLYIRELARNELKTLMNMADIKVLQN